MCSCQRSRIVERPPLPTGNSTQRPCSKRSRQSHRNVPWYLLGTVELVPCCLFLPRQPGILSKPISLWMLACLIQARRNWRRCPKNCVGCWPLGSVFQIGAMRTSARSFPRDRFASRCWRRCSRVPSAFLRKSCQTFLDGPMLPVAISCLPRAIAPICSKRREPGGRAERYRQGIFTCWLVQSPWLPPLSSL